MVRQNGSLCLSLSEVDGVQGLSIKSLDFTDVSLVTVGHVL